MPTNLKRTLFIGLGGTGATALLHTKKRFLDTYGVIPPMIGFLVIDTDSNSKGKNLERENVLKEHENKDSSVDFQQSEFVYSRVCGARDLYERNKETFYNWVPQNNVHVLRNMTTGAGQVRSNGRFSVFHNFDTIKNAVNVKIQEITNIKNEENQNFIVNGAGIEINIVFSIAGGTGSGSFLDVAYLLRSELKNSDSIKIAGYMVLPDVFNSMMAGIGMANTEPNSYGALKELDYFMQNNFNNENRNILINFPHNPVNINSNPFDIVFSINNTNRNGQTINHVDYIAEQIGLALFTGASELSNNVNSVFDNVETILTGGNLDVEGKRAWACGMGTSELFYDGNTLGNIYANKAIAAMIDSLFNTSYEAQTLANNFVDRDNILIRENGGDENNFLIDSLLDNCPTITFSINNNLDAELEAQAFLDNIETNAKKKIEENYDSRKKSVLNFLIEEVKTIINHDSGIGNVLSFLYDLKSLIDVFNGEMIEEERNLRQENDALKNNIQESTRTLRNLQGSVLKFLKTADIRSGVEEIETSVNRRAKCIHELLRREWAQRFFNCMINDINIHITNVEDVKKRLEDAKIQAIHQANNLSNAASDREKVFVVDLHKSELNRIQVRNDVFHIGDFVQTLTPHNNIYEFYHASVPTIVEYFWEYAKQLNESRNYVNKSIDEILHDKTEDELKNIARQLLEKSQTLWQTYDHGYIAPNIHKHFIVGISSLDLGFKDVFTQLIQPGDNIEFVATRVRNKITCFRMEAAVPVFAVSGVANYEREFEDKNNRPNSIAYHVDNLWQRKMQEESFSIWPQKQADNCLPLWVIGLAYGFIRLNNNKNYEVYSENTGDAIDDYWVQLSQYRDLAYTAFKQGNYQDELEKMINQKQQDDGMIITDELRNDIKNNYKDKYIQLNVDWSLIKTPPYQAVADLIRKEIDFIKKEL